MAKTQNKAAGAKTAGKNKKFKKRERKNVPFGLVFIQASFNNTIVTITDQAGQHAVLEVAPARSASAAPARELRLRRSRRPSVQPTQRATTVCARSMCASPVPAPAVSRRSALWPRPVSRCAASATLRRCRTTAAVRRSAAECEYQFVEFWAVRLRSRMTNLAAQAVHQHRIGTKRASV